MSARHPSRLGACMLVAALVLLAPSGSVRLTAAPGAPQAGVPAALGAPQLEWDHGGCTSWCETGWYSSPAVADLDDDGKPEVIGATYTLYALNGEDGSVQWKVPPPSSGARAWPGVVVADLDGDGEVEIVSAHGAGWVRVLNRAGGLVWARQPSSNELRGLAVDDLDGDGAMEVVVTAAVGSKVNTWVYDHAGALLGGWPQLGDDSGYAWGVYNDNAAVGDMDGDGVGEIVVPSDVHYICAYEMDGTQIPANASLYPGKGWGKVGVWESLEVELRGWGHCNGVRTESYRANFAHGPAALADLNGDGAVEVVAVGNVYDCDAGYPPSRYNGVYVFNADRSRFNAGGYDWRSTPVDTGAPLSEDYGVIENNQPNPAVADLDGDGELEILYSSYDGRVHAFWLDKTEHGSWPYAVWTGGPYRFASEPAVVDLDDDGQAEVIVTSWTQKGSGQTGKLHVLSSTGIKLWEVDLPAPVGSWDWNGALAAPTVANIDSDADLEVIVNTAHAGLAAYELPGTAQARILWGTGRGGYQRTGAVIRGSLASSTKHADPIRPAAGEGVTYTLSLRNAGPELSGVRVTDTLPSGVHYAGGLQASSGSAGYAGGVITWTGDVAADAPVTLSFLAQVDVSLAQPIVNRALIDDGSGVPIEREAWIVANGLGVFVPAVWRAP